MTGTFYRGNIAKLVEIHKNNFKTLVAAMEGEQRKTAASLQARSKEELISIINELNTLHQLVGRINKGKDGVISELEDIIKMYAGDIYQGKPIGGAMGQTMKLMRELISEYAILNETAMQLENKLSKNKTNLEQGRIKSVEMRAAAAQKKDILLTESIRPYLKEYPKAGNKEIGRFLVERNFRQQIQYSDTSFEKAVSRIARKCRKELAGQ